MFGFVGEVVAQKKAVTVYVLQLKTEPGLGGVMEGMNVKTLEERSEGDVASPSSTGTQVQMCTCFH